MTTPSADNSENSLRQFLFVMVIHKVNLSETPTYRSLLAQRALFGELGIHVLVVDNTPGEQPRPVAIEHEIEYLSVGENKGLSNAYQTGFLKAKAEGYRFLVLLDDDSEVDRDFLNALHDMVSKRGESEGIWCPAIICGGTPISPWTLNAFGLPDYSPSPASTRLRGINSFSVVAVSVLEDIGGFNQFYWLDCLDFWLYEMAHRRGWTVRRLDVTVEHDLSLVSGRTSLLRLKINAFYESCFVLEYGAPGRIVGTILRLIARGLKRLRVIGGFRNYAYYLHEICKGMRVGLRRRRHQAA